MSRAEPATEPQRSFVTRSFETWSRVASSIPRSAALSMIGPGLLIVLGYIFWGTFGARILDQSLYGLKPENVALSDRPDWIRSDIVGEVFKGSKLDSLTLQDREACSTIAAAFSSHPWIDRVVNARKMSGAQVKVEVEYRRPFAWIYYEKPLAGSPTTSATLQQSSQASSKLDVFYFIVDKQGINLPSRDFTPEDLHQYFHVYCPGVEPPSGPVGSIYPDPRVINALKICELLEDMRIEFGIESVHVVQESSLPVTRWSYFVQLKNGRKIEWGHAPGEEIANEDNASIKIAKVRKQLGGELISTQPKPE